MMDRITGRALDELAHINQSIADIGTTPVGSRIMRPEYGNLALELIDQPLNEAIILQIYSAYAMSVMRWEDRIVITGIKAEVIDAQLNIILTYESVDSNEPFNLSIPLNLGAAA